MSSRSSSAERVRCGARLGPALAIAVALGGCNSLVAQNPPTAMKPVNAVYRVEQPRLMLQGYDLVAYFNARQALPGQPELSVEHEQVIYLFSSAANRDLFQQDPRKYVPAYHGYDAMRMVFAIPERADPRHWAFIDGRLFFFADAASQAAFDLDRAGNVALADRYWADEVLGRLSEWQRTRRLLDPVPHYRNRDALAREVAAAKAKSG